MHAEQLSSPPERAPKYCRSALDKIAARICIACGAPSVTKVHCRACANAQRDASLARIMAIRAEWLKGKACEFCGSTTDLQADHVDPTTKASSLRHDGASIWSMPKADRARELAKCRPLCRACHIERHRLERVTALVHGTTGGYSKGCRCADCRQAATEYARAYSARKRLPATANDNASPSPAKEPAL
jgi:hypothetical protein